MNVTYEICEEHYYLGHDLRISCGIVAYADSDSCGSSTVVMSVHDVTSDSKMLRNLIKECNRLKLSTVHLNEIICDFLAD